MYYFKVKYKKIIISSLIIFLLVCPAGKMDKYEYPVFRFVLDPGHGGISKHPGWKYGDKYDLLSGKYLDTYREGASFRGIREQDIVYSIAEKAHRILLDCSPEGDFTRFKKILKKYSDDEPERIYIISKKSRKESLAEKDRYRLKDPNENFRFFDFPGEGGKTRPGRLSMINNFHPHMVLSIHNAVNPPVEKMGLNPVIVPSYEFLHKGLLYLKGDRSIRKNLNRKIMINWFNQDSRRGSFRWFLSDVSYYFTGYPLDGADRTDYREFSGYRYNMVSWAYRDESGWEKEASRHKPGSRYSKNYGDMVPDGKFWERERSRYERYRREGGEEGYGGDNNYASYEIIRYILFALYMNGINDKSYFPGNPYTGVWIVPLHLNAVSPFIELGYLRKKFDRYVLTKKQDIVAEGIAVGVYSLFSGLKTRDTKFRHKPKGKRIDLEKYGITSEKSYFEAVTE